MPGSKTVALFLAASAWASLKPYANCRLPSVTGTVRVDTSARWICGGGGGAMNKPQQEVRTVRAAALIEGGDLKLLRVIWLNHYSTPLATFRGHIVNNVLIPAPQACKEDPMMKAHLTADA